MRACPIRFAVRFAVVLAAPVLLWGCSSQITICPVAAILADTATMTVFKPGTVPDPANELYTVQMVNAETSCSYNRRDGTTSSDLTLTFHATRPPSAMAATYSVPYFVVVSENAKLYDKKIYTLRFSFAPGAVSADIKQSPRGAEIKIANGKLPWNYELLSGLQVTPAQIAYNKKMGRYLP
jgi:hypothetical protein